MQKPIYINHISSLSALGSGSKVVWEKLCLAEPAFQLKAFKDKNLKVFTSLHKNPVAINSAY